MPRQGKVVLHEINAAAALIGNDWRKCKVNQFHGYNLDFHAVSLERLSTYSTKAFSVVKKECSTIHQTPNDLKD